LSPLSVVADKRPVQCHCHHLSRSNTSSFQNLLRSVTVKPNERHRKLTGGFLVPSEIQKRAPRTLASSLWGIGQTEFVRGLDASQLKLSENWVKTVLPKKRDTAVSLASMHHPWRTTDPPAFLRLSWDRGLGLP